jgi:CMP-N-acetylneuraminic acid synthetase/quercetin dioxygenase-like cupin family protein
MKNVAMIPARLGSKRVHNKNLRLINGKPLIGYIIDAVKRSGVFDEIYLNSESDIMKTVADDYGIKFYKRPDALSTDEATNDDFVLDFINNVKCDTLYQFLATSPFIEAAHIIEFFEMMNDGDYDTLISTTDVQIECIYENKPLNFKQKEKTPPSQSLTPVKAYACGLMAWKSGKFKENISEYDSGYHGGSGKTGFYTLSGFATVDIDTVDDFSLAEQIMGSRYMQSYVDPQYYDPRLHSGIYEERDVPTIIRDDGVKNENYDDENNLITNIPDLLEREGGDSSWIKRIVNSESNSCCVIHQKPGEGNRRHYHHSWNEWWYILKGMWNFEIEGVDHTVKKGDIVYIPKNKWHKITCIGDEPAARLAVSRADVAHVYKI